MYLVLFVITSCINACMFRLVFLVEACILLLKKGLGLRSVFKLLVPFPCWIKKGCFSDFVCMVNIWFELGITSHNFTIKFGLGHGFRYIISKQELLWLIRTGTGRLQIIA